MPIGSALIADTTPWSWQDWAACQDSPTEDFFGPGGEDAAKKLCAVCPVRNDCLDYAINRPEPYGVWGGLNEDERVSERRRRWRAGTLGRAA
nr:WhiB family transcriptional regulator [Nocardiopsis dassonvillei]